MKRNKPANLGGKDPMDKKYQSIFYYKNGEVGMDIGFALLNVLKVRGAGKCRLGITGKLRLGEDGRYRFKHITLFLEPSVAKKHVVIMLSTGDGVRQIVDNVQKQVNELGETLISR